ncbi:MAG: hypothetical protein ABR875_00010 [Minisyncoccia bacterium]|jgi:hypothetical protein
MNQALSESKPVYDLAFEFPKEITNRVKVRERNKDVIYEGKAHSLWADGSDIRGGASLTKIEVTTKTNLERTGWFPAKYKETPVQKEVTIWHIEAESDGRSKYWVSTGKFTCYRDCSADCWDCIKGEAANKGILVSSELMHMVFDSIGQQLVELSNRIKNF